MINWQKEKIHYVCPKPEDVSTLMDGLIACNKRMSSGDVSAVVHSAVISYGFVFLHPFEDGNGRIHRFLIHNILARRKYTPEGMIFPISAAMLKNSTDYDRSLEAFSTPLMTLVDYVLDDEGRITVQNKTDHWYKYIDMTHQVEMLFRFIEQTITDELVFELSFLANYDETKKMIQAIVDMPDQKIDLFIQCCKQNGGTLSSAKRNSHFAFLSDSEISRMEQVIQTIFTKL
jgi:hypothetical protein